MAVKVLNEEYELNNECFYNLESLNVRLWFEVAYISTQIDREMFIFINLRSLKMIVRRRFHRYSIFLSLFIYNHLTGIFVIFPATKNHKNHIFKSRSRQLHRNSFPFYRTFPISLSYKRSQQTKLHFTRQISEIQRLHRRL